MSHGGYCSNVLMAIDVSFLDKEYTRPVIVVGSMTCRHHDCPSEVCRIWLGNDMTLLGPQGEEN